jgi:uncharacterized membrane protein YphA (DoxX/SURF4 family)
MYVSTTTSGTGLVNPRVLKVGLTALAAAAVALSYVLLISVSNQIRPGHWSGWLHVRVDLGSTAGRFFSWTVAIIILLILCFALVNGFRKILAVTFIVFTAMELGWGHDLPHPLDYGGALLLVLIGAMIMFLAYEEHLRRRFGKDWRNR